MAARTFDPVKYARECQGKVGFTSKAMARRNALECQARIGAPMNAYRCSSCRLWHIGHAPWRKRKGAA